MTSTKLLQMRLRVRAFRQQLRRRREQMAKLRLKLALEGIDMTNPSIWTHAEGWVLFWAKHDVVRNLHVALNEYQLEKIDAAINKKRKRA